MHNTLGHLYHLKIHEGHLESDLAQAQAIGCFETLEKQLSTWGVVSELSKDAQGLAKWRGKDGELAPHGLYLFGAVGRGKSMVMDLFFETAPIALKRRVHFHGFMEELHSRMHHVQAPAGVDPLHCVASDIAQEAQLLCFDEFYITNIADAMMLGRFFEMLYACGVTTCATSNWALDHLFQDGFNRVRFKPFITTLKKNMEEVEVQSAKDWRLGNKELPHVYMGDAKGFKKAFSMYVQDKKVSTKALVVQGDDMAVEACVSGLALHVTFAELCEKPYGREHYIDLAENFNHIFISGLYALQNTQADTAMRFIVLIDILYESDTPCTLLSDVPLEEICTSGDALFAYGRTLSRLYEMNRW